MPVTPTYPGVYIEEIPSGVHTLTGVATSITAFIGYTTRGATDQAVHIFSYSDFVRAFGDLDIESPVSYCVKQFFQNGGSEAYVVRVARGSVKASVTLKDAGGVNVLDVTAKSSGTWANTLQIDVDYFTVNPDSLFNLRVTEMLEQNGKMVPGREEKYRNLSMNSVDSRYAVATVNSDSQLIEIARTVNVNGQGSSQSGLLTAVDLGGVNATHNKLGVVLDGGAPFEITLTIPPAALTPAALAADIVAQINAVKGAGAAAIAAAPPAGTIGITSAASERSAVHFINAATSNAADVLKLGLANGGIEADGAAAFRPAQTGTGATFVLPAPAVAAGDIKIDIQRGAPPATVETTGALSLWDTAAATPVPQPATLDELTKRIDAAIKAFAALSTTNVNLKELLDGWTIKPIGNSIRFLPSDPSISLNITSTTAGLISAPAPNVGRYVLGAGVTALSQVQGKMGNNGTIPGAAELMGSEANKSGIYALEDVDLFNLLVMPEATATGGTSNVVQEAIAYCERRRAFMIIDTPDSVNDLAAAQTWMNASTGAGALRSRNAAIYFPHVREQDPMQNNVVRAFPAAGVVAGLYARTDADRGVWKAPAGITATLSGVTGLSYTMNDRENGTLNPLGLNCLRTFPVYGSVSWGARTARGADVMTDEYKYVPVRRLALYLEESLYRGTKWVVFEPNDEPLWAQIRLNLGAFMHTLFAQGAFQGQTPRDAYFVKCDKETTTQNDIDLGRVNIVVGFAPLKPAEFVIIQIQQIARGIQV